MSTTTGLSDKKLVMLVGPTSIGKSTLMNAVVEHDSRFSRVRSFTTRPPRANDESGHYFYLTEKERVVTLQKGDIVTDVIYPTTGYHYGTLMQSYDGEYNLLDTLANSVADYRELPFEKTVTISISADPDDWEQWLNIRYPEAGAERTNRLQEAVLSIEWSLAQTNRHAWLVNEAKNIGPMSRRVVELATGGGKTLDWTHTPPEATNLLERAKTLLSYE